MEAIIIKVGTDYELAKYVVERFKLGFPQRSMDYVKKYMEEGTRLAIDITRKSYATEKYYSDMHVPMITFDQHQEKKIKKIWLTGAYTAVIEDNTGVHMEGCTAFIPKEKVKEVWEALQ